MGFATGYVAVRDLSQEEILTRLGAALGDAVKEPFLSAAPTALSLAENGWTVIADSANELWHSSERLAPLSKGTVLVTAFMEEHVMYAHAELHDNVWQVVSDSGENPQITSQGTPPADLPGLIEEGVDYHFEVPFKLVTEATGGVVDGGFPWPEGGFRELLFR
ncbi:hypothetical protein ACQEU3_24345 [Spirillospora sp. CA-253888]